MGNAIDDARTHLISALFKLVVERYSISPPPILHQNNSFSTIISATQLPVDRRVFIICQSTFSVLSYHQKGALHPVYPGTFHGLYRLPGRYRRLARSERRF